VAPIDRSLWKRESPRIWRWSAGLLSCERPFKFPSYTRFRIWEVKPNEYQNNSKISSSLLVFDFSQNGSWKCIDPLRLASRICHRLTYRAMGTTVLCIFSNTSPIPCPPLYPCPCQFLYGSMTIYVRHGNHLVDPQRPCEEVQKLKGPLTWGGMGKMC
jgi:hypothetical protein